MIDTLAHPDEEVKYVGVVIKQCSAVDVVVEGRLGLCVKSRVEVFLDLQRERLSWRRRGGAISQRNLVLTGCKRTGLICTIRGGSSMSAARVSLVLRNKALSSTSSFNLNIALLPSPV